MILDDTGHVPMLERPAKFNELLEELIEGPAALARRPAPRSR